MKYIVDIKGEIEGDYEIIGKYEGRPQVNVIPQECIKVLAETVVDVVQQIDWTSLCEKVAERPQGEWKRDNYGDVFCSNCGVECAYNEEGLYSLGRFCHHCGADMRKGDES